MKPRLITSKAYARAIVRDITNAQKRIMLLALIIQQNEDSADIIQALVRAASRGVNVQVVADFSTYSYLGGHITPRTIYDTQLRAASDMVNRLLLHNARFEWVGMGAPFMFAGRTHSKWSIIDNVVYVGGGINLHHKISYDADYMLRFRNAELADIVAREHERILHADRQECAYRSRTVTCDYGEILIDGGLVGDSVIYRRAVDLARQASSVLLVTQYAPTGKLARCLRQTTSNVYYNQPSKQEFFTRLLIEYGKRVDGVASLYKRSAYIHAKFMIARMKDGQKIAITGSHNFVSLGGALGTREIALQTTRHDIISQLEAFHETYIA